MRLDGLWVQLPHAFCAGMCAERGAWLGCGGIILAQGAMLFAEHLSRCIDAKAAELRATVDELQVECVRAAMSEPRDPGGER